VYVNEPAVWIQTCKPNCATGGSTRYSGTLRASGVSQGHYTRLALSYTKGNGVIVQRYMLTLAGRVYGWQ
jgi:hypothetical protein